MTSLLVNEIYPCLQGEGVNIGKPSVLLRLQICNLRCKWCDTPYTHTFKSDPIDSSEKQHFRRMEIRDIAATIRELNCNHVIISGGEPTLQNFAGLVEYLPKHTFEVESNGTRIPHLQLPGFKADDYKKFQWNISPKGRVAGEKIIEDAILHWSELSNLHEKIFFKFVIRKNHVSDDIDEVLSIAKKYSIDEKNILLMAEGTSIESQIQNTWLHDLCLKYNFRYSPRLHVLLFGPQRGI